VPEGDDKPAKYPVMFRAADLMLLTKTDLLEVLDDFKPENAEQYMRRLSSEAPVMQVSSKTGDGIQDWLDWLQQELEAHRARIQNGEIVRPAIQPDGMRFHAVTDSAAHHHGHDHSHG
jgi:hydrogenase nickel incorporation protein HypB